VSVLWGALTATPAGALPPEVFGYFRNSDPSGVLLPRNETTSTTGPLSDIEQPLWSSGGGAIARYDVDYGLVRIYAKNDWFVTEPDGFTNAGPSAGWRDLLTVTAPGVPAGTSGTIELAIRVTGTVTTGPYGAACALVNIGLFAQVFNCNFSGNVMGPGFGSFSSHPISFLFGEPFDFFVEVSADAGGDGGLDGSALVDLSSTVAYDGVIEVRDVAQQTTVGAFAITSASGFDYDVPEPNADVLGLAALAAITVVARSGRAIAPRSRPGAVRARRA
jgi:hypothetical protein